MDREQFNQLMAGIRGVATEVHVAQRNVLTKLSELERQIKEIKEEVSDVRAEIYIAKATSTSISAPAPAAAPSSTLVPAQATAPSPAPLSDHENPRYNGMQILPAYLGGVNTNPTAGPALHYLGVQRRHNDGWLPWALEAITHETLKVKGKSKADPW